MTELKLIPPSADFFSQLTDYRNEFIKSGDVINGGARLSDISDLSAWLQYVEAIAQGKVEEGRIPSSTFLCIRQSDQKMVGICNIRHNLSQDYAFNHAGHIGYSICPSERHKGYAKEQLRLALQEAYKLGIQRALLTCDEANIASEKTISACGGIYENTYQNETTGERTKRFWIEVSQ